MVDAAVSSRGWCVSARRHPETKGKGYGFWHVISEASQINNRNEGERIPNLRRCELKPHRRESFERERTAFYQAQKD